MSGTFLKFVPPSEKEKLIRGELVMYRFYDKDQNKIQKYDPYLHKFHADPQNHNPQYFSETRSTGEKTTGDTGKLLLLLSFVIASF